MTPAERRTVLRAAGLPLEWHQYIWPQLRPANQHLVIEQVREFSRWAAQLQNPPTGEQSSAVGRAHD
jgi:hypothetical protein